MVYYGIWDGWIVGFVRPEYFRLPLLGGLSNDDKLPHAAADGRGGNGAVTALLSFNEDTLEESQVAPLKRDAGILSLMFIVLAVNDAVPTRAWPSSSPLDEHRMCFLVI